MFTEGESSRCKFEMRDAVPRMGRVELPPECSEVGADATVVGGDA